MENVLNDVYDLLSKNYLASGGSNWSLAHIDLNEAEKLYKGNDFSNFVLNKLKNPLNNYSKYDQQSMMIKQEVVYRVNCLDW